MRRMISVFDIDYIQTPYVQCIFSSRSDEKKRRGKGKRIVADQKYHGNDYNGSFEVAFININTGRWRHQRKKERKRERERER